MIHMKCALLFATQNMYKNCDGILGIPGFVRKGKLLHTANLGWSFRF